MGPESPAAGAPARALRVVRVPVASLVPDPANARTYPVANVDAIGASLRRFGQAEPLIVQARTRRVVAGHRRIVAMRSVPYPGRRVDPFRATSHSTQQRVSIASRMDPQDEALRPDELVSQLAWVRRLARGLVADADASNDVVQQVCLLALQRAPTGARSGPPFRAWLAAVTRSLVRRSARSTFRRERRERAAALPEALPATVDTAVHREALRRLVDAVTSLDEPYYSAVVARYFKDRSVAEMAAQSGESAAAIRQRLARARKQLRVLLQAGIADEAGGKLQAALPVAASPATITHPWAVFGRLGGSIMATTAGKGGLTKAAVGIAVLMCLMLGTWLVFDERFHDGSSPAGAEHPVSGDARDQVAQPPGLPTDAPASPKPLAGAVEALPFDSGSAHAGPGDPVLVTGRVVDVAGQPLPDALVTHWPGYLFREQAGLPRNPLWDGVPWKDLPSTRTGTDGRFSLPARDVPPQEQSTLAVFGGGWWRDSGGAEGRPTLFVEHAGHAMHLAPLPEWRSGACDVGDIVLRDAATLTARLVDAEGRGVVGVAVGLQPTARRGSNEERPLRMLALRLETVSDDEGRILIAGVPLETWEICGEPQDFAPFRHKVALAAPGLHDTGDIALQPGVRLGGRVVDAQGLPVDGAEVVVRPHMDFGIEALTGADVAAALWSARMQSGGRFIESRVLTGTDGSFELRNLVDWPRGYRVVARAPGLDPAEVHGVIAGRTDIELSLEPQATWRLAVVDAEDGTPLPDAVVRAARRVVAGGEDDDWRVSIDFAREGDTWRLVGAGRHRTEVVVSAPGHATQGFVLPGLPAGSAETHEVRLSRGRSAHGFVQDDEGQPLAGARVTLTPPQDAEIKVEPLYATADALGRFRFDGLQPGTWQCGVTAGGFLPLLDPLPLAVPDEGAAAALEVTLVRGGAITGTLLDADGQPASGELVLASSKDPAVIAAALAAGTRAEHPAGAESRKSPDELEAQSITGADGRFRLAGLPPGLWTLQDQHGAQAVVDLPPRGEVEALLARPRAPRVAGRVTAGGAPVAGATVELGFGHDIGSAWMALRTTRSGPGGEFELQHNAEGDQLFLLARDGQARVGPVPVTLEWNRLTHVDLAFGTSRVTGRVVDADGGAPLPDVSVELRGAAIVSGDFADPFRLSTHSDPHGRFAFERVQPRTYALWAGGGLFLPVQVDELRVVEGASVPEQVLSLALGAEVLVELEGFDLVQVELASPDGQETLRDTGRFKTARLAPVRPGAWELRVNRREGKSWVLEHAEHVELAAGQTLRRRVVAGG